MSVRVMEKVKRYWEARGWLSESTATPDDVARVEQLLQLSFPLELRTYFTEVNGMKNDEWDDFLIEFFSLQRCFVLTDLESFRGIPDYGNLRQVIPTAQRHLVIASYSIHCHVYTVELGSESNQEFAPTYMVAGSAYQLIANSWSEFLALYPDDSARIFGDRSRWIRS